MSSKQLNQKVTGKQRRVTLIKVYLFIIEFIGVIIKLYITT